MGVPIGWVRVGWVLSGCWVDVLSVWVSVGWAFSVNGLGFGMNS